jgi:quercetin dioxygenase-like cupin family protein
MAIPHARAGEVIDIRPLGPALSQARTTTLVKTNVLEVLRLVVKAGSEIPPHKVNGEITVQCLEGSVGFLIDGGTRVLEAGQMMFLTGGEMHAVRGIQDASVLVTILLQREGK